MNKRDEQKDGQGLVLALKETPMSLLYNGISVIRKVLTNQSCAEKSHSDGTNVQKGQFQVGGILATWQALCREAEREGPGGGSCKAQDPGTQSPSDE